jgi:hypothetical protein
MRLRLVQDSLSGSANTDARRRPRRVVQVLHALGSSTNVVDVARKGEELIPARPPLLLCPIARPAVLTRWLLAQDP